MRGRSRRMLGTLTPPASRPYRGDATATPSGEHRTANGLPPKTRKRRCTTLVGLAAGPP